ncbi:MAG: 16S rRNA (guanine(527)-N(7))-methyltransferase RsmG [Oscillospiraceae bacterium]|jgi:16S rRNA (guanine527-N7)-methyltransferase|nr:16S rRNA (guanine(527)-N(7))-methyltransferase RsmG [Oscillospiraceae bacterium]
MRAALTAGLAALGLDPALCGRLEAFAGLVLERNQVMNLTAITEPSAFAGLHLLDSLSLIPLAGLSSGTVVDVGTGAGFPGVPLAIALPEARVTLLDSLGKRIEFLRETCGALGLENTRCVHARAEEFGEREQFDWAVSRAVAPLPMLCELSLPLVRVGGRFLAMKSSHSQEELDEAGRAISILGGRVDWVKDYPIPGAEIQHRLICIEKTTPTPRKYPRRFSQLKKQPL